MACPTLSFATGEPSSPPSLPPRYFCFTNELTPSNTLWLDANKPDDSSSAVFYFHDPVLECAETLRILLDVVGGFRLPYWKDDAWPCPPLVLAILQLARKYQFTMAYDVIVAYCQMLINRRADTSRHLVGMFRVAAILDDELLATMCVARISEDHGRRDGESIARGERADMQLMSPTGRPSRSLASLPRISGPIFARCAPARRWRPRAWRTRLLKKCSAPACWPSRVGVVNLSLLTYASAGAGSSSVKGALEMIWRCGKSWL